MKGSENRYTYDVDEENKNLLEKARDKSIPKYSAEVVIKQLTDSVQNIINLTEKSSYSTLNMLNASTNPMLAPEEFSGLLIEPLRKHSQNSGNQSFDVLASDLQTVRSFYTQDKQFIQSTYKREIEMVEKPSLEEKQSTFTKFLSTLTKYHVQDVKNQIEKESKER